MEALKKVRVQCCDGDYKAKNPKNRSWNMPIYLVVKLYEEKKKAACSVKQTT